MRPPGDRQRHPASRLLRPRFFLVTCRKHHLKQQPPAPLHRVSEQSVPAFLSHPVSLQSGPQPALPGSQWQSPNWPCCAQSTSHVILESSSKNTSPPKPRLYFYTVITFGAEIQFSIRILACLAELILHYSLKLRPSHGLLTIAAALKYVHTFCAHLPLKGADWFPSPWMWARPRDLLLMNRIWQKSQYVTRS